MADTITLKSDAYKGDGMKGMGDFLAGIAQAYHELDRHTAFAESHLTPQQKAQVQSWVDTAAARFGSAEFSKGAAFSDADSLMDGIFQRFRESDLPQIFSRNCKAGVYNSTTAQLLANDAYARKVREAAEVKVKTAVDYAGIETQRSQPLAQALQAALSDSTSRTEDVHEEVTPKTEAFAADMAAFVAAFALLDIISRKYFADSE